MKKPPLYAFIKAVASVVLALFTPYRLIKKADLPADGKVIICSNHVSLLDPVYLGILTKRTVFFMAKAELFKSKLSAWFIRGLGGFPVERGKGDMDALKSASDVLEANQVLGVFIEGTRSKTGELLRPKTGAAALAFQNHAPVFPVCVTAAGGKKVRCFRRVIISFGEEIVPEELGFTEGGSAEFRRASRKIMDQITKLREEALAEFGKKGKKECSTLQD